VNSIRNLARLTVGIIALVAIAMPSARAEDSDKPTYFLEMGFGDTVTAIRVEPPSVKPTPLSATSSGLKCEPAEDTFVLVPTRSSNAIAFCVTATVKGLSVGFLLPEPLRFASPATLNCTRLRGPGNLVDVIVSVGQTGGASVARAECGFDAAFLYAVSVETPPDPSSAPNEGEDRRSTWAFSIPWTELHLRPDSTSLDISFNGAPCPIKIRVQQAKTAVVAADYAPTIRLNLPSPAPGSAPPRLHGVEFNVSANPDEHNRLAGSFAQNQATVAVQRALQQALSLAPVPLPTMTPAAVLIGQDLQAQSLPLFGFAQPSTFLEDTSIKPLFDVLPFSLTKVSSLAAGYAYGYTTRALNGAAFYGLQGPNTYTGAASVTLILATPPPTPASSPKPCPTPPRSLKGTPPHVPLKLLPPPAPFLESATSSTPPLQLFFFNGFSLGSTGTRDTVDALAFAGHLYNNQTSGDPCASNSYHAETLNVFGRLELDYRSTALGVSPPSWSQFLGESGSITVGRVKTSPTPMPMPSEKGSPTPMPSEKSSPPPRASYFQVHETVGVQLNDRNFSPTVGTSTWLSSLSGPVGHLTASFAGGTHARYYTLDLFGFRLTNGNGDIAAQEGWEVSLPIGSQRGWLLSGGSETQTVSDRVAAVEQGLLSNYSLGLTQVLPIQGSGTVPPSPVRPQRLGNIRIDTPALSLPFAKRKSSPEPSSSPLPKAPLLRFIAGYDFGTVTGCGATPASTPKTPMYQCLTVTDNRIVGGAFLQNGSFSIGATDAAVASGAVSANDAARNLGTSGGSPGSTTVYLTYSECPQLTVAYTNAAFPPNVPLPLQGTTLSAQLDFPFSASAQQYDLVLGYFNEHAPANPGFAESGFSLVLRLGGRSDVASAKPAVCNRRKKNPSTRFSP
jgi:hypothetical protein